MRNPIEGKPIRVALIGSEGRVANYYKNALRGEEKAGRPVEITVFDSRHVANPQLVTEAKANGLRVADTLEDALSQADIAYILTPDHIRQPAIDALQTSSIRMVVIEKPVATDPLTAEQINDLAQANGKKVIVGTGYRETFQPVIRRIQNGEIGNPISAYADYRHYMQDILKTDRTTYGTDHPWRENQDPYYGAATHPIDTLIYLFGDVATVRTTESTTGNNPEYNHPDIINIDITFKNGVVAHVLVDLATKTALNEHGTAFEVEGATGCIKAHNKKSEYQIVRKNDSVTDSYTMELPYTIDKLVERAHAIIRGEESQHQPFPTIAEALRTIYVIEAAKLSGQTGQIQQVVYRRQRLT